MKIRGIDIAYDKTDVDDVTRFEDALNRYLDTHAQIVQTQYDTNAAKLAAGCEAAADLLRTAFCVDLIEATGVNPRSLMQLTDLIVEITDAMAQENKRDNQKIQHIMTKYGNVRQ